MTTNDIGCPSWSPAHLDEQEKKMLQKELSTWTKKIPLIVGFETVAEALLDTRHVHFLTPKSGSEGEDDSPYGGRSPSATAWRGTSTTEDSKVKEIFEIRPESPLMTKLTTDSGSEDESNLRQSVDEQPLDLSKGTLMKDTPAGHFNGSTTSEILNSRGKFIDVPDQLPLWPPAFKKALDFQYHYQSLVTRIFQAEGKHDAATAHWKTELPLEMKRLNSNDPNWGQVKRSRSKTSSSQTSTPTLTVLASADHVAVTKAPGFENARNSTVKEDSTLVSSKIVQGVQILGNENKKSNEKEEILKIAKENLLLDFRHTEPFESFNFSDDSASLLGLKDVATAGCDNSIFQTTNRLEQLLMSIITKNIYEKYRYLKAFNGTRNCTSPDSGTDPRGVCAKESEDLAVVDSKLEIIDKVENSQNSSTSVQPSQENQQTTKPPSDKIFPNSFNSFSSKNLTDILPAYYPASLGFGVHCKDQNHSSGSQSSSTVSESTNASPSSSCTLSNPIKKTRPKRGQYRRYNRQLLLDAVRAVQQGDMSVHRAGSYFGVPHSTLEYKVKERHLLRYKKSAQDQQRRDNNVQPKLTSGSTIHGQKFSLYSTGVDSKSQADFVKSKDSRKTSNNLAIPADTETPQCKKRCDSQDQKSVPLLHPFHTSTAYTKEFRYPFINDTYLRGNTPPIRNPNIFEGLASTYNWLIPGFAKSFPFSTPVTPQSNFMMGSFFPTGFQHPAFGVDQFRSASELLKKLHFSASSAQKEEIMEPHSTTGGEIDLRVTRK